MWLVGPNDTFISMVWEDGWPHTDELQTPGYSAPRFSATDRLSLGRCRNIDGAYLTISAPTLHATPVLVADGAAAADRADHFQLLLLKGQDIQ